jgi:hypothetical protein
MTAEDRAARVYSRACGECNLCCKLLPVANLHASNTWCQHAVKGKGCGIYPARPTECRAWACFWLADANVADHFGLRRPDQTHYVIDEAADIVGVRGKQMPCLQVWVDPGYPNAWRSDEALRRFIHHAAITGVVTLIRYGDVRARVVLAPPLNPVWEEIESQYTRVQTSEEEKQAFFNKPPGAEVVS